MIFKAAVIQLKLSDNEGREERFLQVERRLEEICAQQIRPMLVMLPETWATGFSSFDRYTAESEPLQGETFARLAPWAEKLQCYLLAGSMIEREGERYYNTSLLIRPDGRLAGRYRKIHLFGYRSRESVILSPGSDILTLDTDYGAWGITTCYDLRFPELYRRMAEAGAVALLVVAAWPLSRLEHWVLFNRVRALENLCYLISCNCAGTLKGSAMGGNSMAVDPWGDVVARAGLEDEILYAELDMSKVDAIRTQFPALRDRRLI